RGRDALALSLAADVALLEDRPADAEEHAATALRLVDDPDLHLRVALAQAARGRLAPAIEILDAQLAADPGLERAGHLRARLLEEVQQLDSPPAEARQAVDRFLDRTALIELQAAVAQFVGAQDDRTGSFADGLQEWIEAGALTEEELSEWTD